MRSSFAHREPEALQLYQRQLNEVLDDTAPMPDAVIALEIDGQGWLVALQDLSETSLCPRLATTGSMPEGARGVGNFRGKVNTVLSMPVLMGMETGAYHGQGWATVLHPRFGSPLALWWPRMLGLFSRGEFVRAASVEMPSYCNAVWRGSDARSWYELDTERFLRERLGLDPAGGGE